MADQKVLITGATGFIGGHLVRRLIGDKCPRVRGLARNVARAEGLAKLGAEVVQGDLGDATSLRRAVEGCSVVIHAGAQVSAIARRETFERSNALGTENLLEACVTAGVARFVHISSIAVFGLPTSGEITDESPRGPCGDPYCDTKFEAEEVVSRFIRDRSLPVSVIRPSCVYGPGSTHWSVIPLKRIRKGTMFLVNGGRGTLNYVYIDNLVDAILLAAKDDRAVGEAFIVNDGATTWQDFLGTYARMLGKKGIPSVPHWVARGWVAYRNLVAVLRRETSRVPPNALAFLEGKAVYRQSHIERKLAHRPRVDLVEGMRRTEAWFRQTGLL